MLRFPKTPLGAELPAVRRVGGVDVLAEPAVDEDVDVLVITVGAIAADVLAAADSVRQAGFSVRVVDPGWVLPVDPELAGLAARASLVVTAEDGSAAGGIGTRIGQMLAENGVRTPVRQIGVPSRFPAHGSVTEVKSWAGLTIQDIGRRIVEWSVVVSPHSEPDSQHGDDVDSGIRDARRTAGSSGE